MNKLKNSGQSLVDLIFSVGIIVLVLSGVVVLMVNSVSTKTKGFDRKTASRMAEVVMEGLIADEENDPEDFYGRTGLLDQSLSEFPDYKYDVDYRNSDGRISGCSNCILVAVTVRWRQGGESFILTRVFSK